MIYKEEQILLPICLERFTADEWAEIWASSPRYGWCLVEPRQDFKPVDLQAANRASTAGGIGLPTGTLALEQLIAIFSTLPVDLTFVDADDRVAFRLGGSKSGFRPEPRHHRTDGAELPSSAQRGCRGSDSQRLSGRAAGCG